METPEEVTGDLTKRLRRIRNSSAGHARPNA